MKQIAFWVIAVAIYTMIGMPAAWANDGRLFTVSSESWETVHTEGLGALTGDQNVYALLTNSNCGQLGFRTLLQTRREALAVATDLSRQLQRQMFVYEVRSTENMYSLAASVAQVALQQGADRGDWGAEVVEEIAKKHQKTNAQVLISFRN